MPSIVPPTVATLIKLYRLGEDFECVFSGQPVKFHENIFVKVERIKIIGDDTIIRRYKPYEDSVVYKVVKEKELQLIGEFSITMQIFP